TARRSELGWRLLKAGGGKDDERQAADDHEAPVVEDGAQDDESQAGPQIQDLETGEPLHAPSGRHFAAQITSEPGPAYPVPTPSATRPIPIIVDRRRGAIGCTTTGLCRAGVRRG